MGKPQLKLVTPAIEKRAVAWHAMGLDKGNPPKLDHDPSAGIKRPKTKEIRAWSNFVRAKGGPV